MKKHLLKGLLFAPFILIGISSSAQSNSIPVFNTLEEKQKWINEHQEEYNQAQNAPAAQTTTISSEPIQTVEHSELPSSFPVYVNTGNKEKDDADYLAAKLAWIAAHPQEYADMTKPKN